MWYTFVGTMTTIIIAIVITFITGKVDPSTIDKKLLAPCIRKYIKHNDNSKMNQSDNLQLRKIPKIDVENCAK